MGTLIAPAGDGKHVAVRIHREPHWRCRGHCGWHQGLLWLSLCKLSKLFTEWKRLRFLKIFVFPKKLSCAIKIRNHTYKREKRINWKRGNKTAVVFDGMIVYVESPEESINNLLELKMWGASLVAQWLRICLPMQGTRVRALVREDPTCCRATKPVHHNYWACTLDPASHNYWSRTPQLLKPVCLEPMLCNKRSHCHEKPVHHNEE